MLVSGFHNMKWLARSISSPSDGMLFHACSPQHFFHVSYSPVAIRMHTPGVKTSRLRVKRSVHGQGSNAHNLTQSPAHQPIGYHVSLRNQCTVFEMLFVKRVKSALPQLLNGYTCNLAFFLLEHWSMLPEAIFFFLFLFRWKGSLCGYWWSP